MPRDINGTYTLPSSAFVPDTTILSASVNDDLSDIALALTQSLATTGVSGMLGPLKLADGTKTAPSLTFATELTTGFYKNASGTLGFAIADTDVFTLSGTLLDIITENLVINTGDISILAGDVVTNTGDVNVNTGNISIAIGDLDVDNASKNLIDRLTRNVYATPIGAIANLGTTTLPDRWLACNGQAVSRTTYSALFTAIGTTFGVGDGSTTFNLPDYRGRIHAGDDAMGASAAGRLTLSTAEGCDGTIGDVGGEQGHQLSLAEMPTHSHLYEAASFTSTRNTGGAQAATSPAASSTTSLTGGDTAHNNVQPTLVAYKMIYAGV